MALILLYGAAEWRPDSNAPKVEIDASAHDPLRLNDGPYEFTDLPEKAGTGTAAERLAILEDHLAAFCDQFARRPRQFLALYFRFITETIAADRAAIAAKVRPFAGLFTVEDYGFSALRPLPRAHVPAGDRRIRVDFAFWTGEKIVGIDIIGDDARGAPWDARRQALDAAGIRRIEIPAAAITRDDVAVLRDHLPHEFAAFWQSEAMPSSPFRSAGLGDIVTETPEF